MFNKFPYTDFHEMNCDEIIKWLEQGRETLNHVIEQTTILDDKVANIDHKIAEIETKVNEGIERIEVIIEEAEGVKEEMRAIYDQVVEAGERAEENARFVEDVIDDVTPAVTATNAKKYFIICDNSKIEYHREMFWYISDYLNVPSDKVNCDQANFSFSGVRKWSSFNFEGMSWRNPTDVVLIGGYADTVTTVNNNDVAELKNKIKTALPHANIIYCYAYKIENAFNKIYELYRACVNNGIAFIDLSYCMTNPKDWEGGQDRGGIIYGHVWADKVLRALGNELVSHACTYCEHYGLDFSPKPNAFTVLTPSYQYDKLFAVDVSKEYTHLLMNELNLRPSGDITLNMKIGRLYLGSGRQASTLDRFYTRVALQDWGDITGTYDAYVTLNGDYIELNIQGVPGVATGETPIPKANNNSFITIYPSTSSIPTCYLFVSQHNRDNY